MAEEKLDPEAREALEELEQYLSDILPPLVVADSVKLLLKYPPELTASAIHSWTVSQLRAGTDILVSDYLGNVRMFPTTADGQNAVTSRNLALPHFW